MRAPHKEIVHINSLYNKAVIGGFVIRKVNNLCTLDAIVITNSFREYGILMDAIGILSWRNHHTGQYQTTMNYNQKWVWTIKYGSYSGSAGWKCQENHEERNPKLPVFSNPFHYYLMNTFN